MCVASDQTETLSIISSSLNLKIAKFGHAKLSNARGHYVSWLSIIQERDHPVRLLVRKDRKGMKLHRQQ